MQLLCVHYYNTMLAFIFESCSMDQGRYLKMSLDAVVVSLVIKLLCGTSYNQE